MDRETASIICHYHYKSKTTEIQPYGTCPVYSTGTDTRHIHSTVPLREKQKDLKVRGERKKKENISIQGDSFSGSVNEMWPSLPLLCPGSALPAPFSSFDLSQAPTECNVKYQDPSQDISLLFKLESLPRGSEALQLHFPEILGLAFAGHRADQLGQPMKALPLQTFQPASWSPWPRS